MRKVKNKRKYLMGKIWEIMSEYIRRKNSKNDMVACITCGEVHNWKELHAGHFIPAGSSLKWRYDERNVHPQCPYCNTYLHGNLARYTLKMQEMYGNELVEEMLQDKASLKPFKLGIGDLEELLERYKQKLIDIL